MFDSTQCENLKASVLPFTLEQPFDSTVSMPLSMQLYMEFYGFFDTVKALEVEYFWGMRSVDVSATSCRKTVIPSPIGIATHFWSVPNAKACIYIVHGLFDHVGLFQKLIRHLLLQGYSVVAIDLPGHGLSEGKSTQVGDFAEYAEVVLQTQQYFQQVLGDTPCVAIGQSTGAAVLMSAAFILSKKAESAIFECLVFLGPLVRPRGFKLGRLVYSLLHRFIAQIKRDFNRPNSNDADFHLFLQFQDPLQARALSIQWLGAMFSWVEQFSSQPVINIPLLILQGTGDKVVDWEFNVSAIQEHFPQSQVSYVKGAKHHLANEAVPWRKVVFGGVTQFIRRAQINR